MDLTSLFETIQRTFNINGFKLCPILRNSMSEAHFVVNESDVYKKKIGSVGCSYEAYYGNWITVKQVFHRNQAKMNTSYYLDPCECERSSSHTIPGFKKLKVKAAWTEVTVMKRVTKFLTDYKKYLTNKIVSDKIDEYLSQM